mgnify:CR=1 FL=1
MSDCDTVRRGRQNFCILSNQVIDDDRLSSNAKLTYMILCRYANTESGECFPAQNTIATKAGICCRSVQSGLEELITLGYITKEVRHRDDGSQKFTSNLYTVHDFDEAVRTTCAREEEKPYAPGAEELNSSVTESGENETSALEAYRAPPASVRKKKRGAFWKECGDLTTERGGHWAAGPKEANCLDKLLAWSKVTANGGYEKYLRDFLEGAWALHEGTVRGLSQRDKEYWALQPYTPSRLLCNALAICNILNVIADKNRPSDVPIVSTLFSGAKW